MTRTFEELAGQELDALYQGALFLSGGDGRAAQALLVDAVSVAFREYPYEQAMPSVERWLEGRLVRSFLERLGDGPPRLRKPSLPSPSAIAPGSLERMGPRELFEAAGAVPAWPRAALWLVLLRRWSYAAAASALGVERGELVVLLEHRDALIQAIASASRGRRGLMSNGG